MNGMNDRLVWIDCEMTGLDLTRDALIEVAALVTDSELNVLGDGVDVVIKPPAGAVEQMLPVVREMHTASGLLNELPGGMELAEAQRLVLGYVQRYAPEARKAPLAGNTVGTDRGFLARDMPALEGHLHYRVVDVSSIKELVRRWYPRVYFQAPPKTGNHRALGDIKDSIEELRYYRATVFVPLPGPDSETARATAALFGTGNGTGTGSGAATSTATGTTPGTRTSPSRGAGAAGTSSRSAGAAGNAAGTGSGSGSGAAPA